MVLRGSTGLGTCCYATTETPFEAQCALLLKVEIILTSQSMLWFSQPDGGFREPVWDHKCCLECTTANIENNECKWLGGLADDSLCILNSSQLRMLKEHLTHSATVVLFAIKSWEKSAPRGQLFIRDMHESTHVLIMCILF